MSNNEYYDDEAYYAMQEEYAFQQAMQDNSFESGETIPATWFEFKISNNYEHYDNLMEYVMNMQQPLELSIGLDLYRNIGLPYYIAKIDNFKKKIFITKEIYFQIYDYLKNGVIPDKMPNVENVYKNQNENFILLHLRVDKNNKVTHYSPETKEYKAKYPHGVINYGQLPYTTDELVAKLNSL